MLFVTFVVAAGPGGRPFITDLIDLVIGLFFEPLIVVCSYSFLIAPSTKVTCPRCMY